MAVKTVRVVPHDPSWPSQFAAERDDLLPVFGKAATAIHHIGSTSVPGLAAKPVLDILVEATSLRDVDALAPALESRGYQARGEYGVPGRRYFSRLPRAGLKVHIHVFEVGHPHAGEQLLLRDYLRAHPRCAAQYGALKIALASEHADDRDAYQAAKADFVADLLRKAGAWRRECR